MVSPKSSTESSLSREWITRETYRTSMKKSMCRKVCLAFVIIFVVASGMLYHGSTTDFSHEENILEWIDRQQPYAWRQVLANLGGMANTQDVSPGAVIASPSTKDPDYYFQWVRDAAITYKVIIQRYILGNDVAHELGPLIRKWSASQDRIQRTANPSGEYLSGGLGEPKFLVNDSPYTGSWGRPQNDGPAIRATALITFVQHVIAEKGTFDDLSTFYSQALPPDSIIKADLEYISHNWANESFDLWEEVNGLHFFTLMVQLRALLEGSIFARQMFDDGAASWYSSQAGNIREKLDEFWSDKGWLVATLNHQDKREGLDCGTILGSLHGSSELQTAYRPHSEKLLATHFKLMQAMQDLYKVNHAHMSPGIAIGRYPEDVYDGNHKSIGNPWFLCTAAAAEQMYTARNLLAVDGNITVTAISLDFYQQFLPGAKAGSIYAQHSDEFTTIVAGMRQLGDDFLRTVQRFSRANGSLSEQFNRDTGQQQGARDLTWSYVALLSAIDAKLDNVQS